MGTTKEKLGKTIAYSTLLAIGALGTLSACESGQEICLSLAVVSDQYTGDKAPGVTDQDRTSWQLGILATTANLPRDDSYLGLVVGFRNPTDPNADWHASNPVPAKNNADQAIALKIGSGNVQFQTQIEATAGSVDCAIAPATTFSQPTQFDQISGTQPAWS